MMNTSYMQNNVNNYAQYLLNNGLAVGDRLKKNHGGNRTGNKIFEVVEITETEIKLSCVDIKFPSISQKKNMKKEMAEQVVIEIAKCGSFPAFIKA